MKLKPLRDFVIVAPIKVENVTPDGIHLPDSVTKDQTHVVIAKVLAVGPGIQLENGDFQLLGIEVDDYVIFSAGAPVFPIKQSSIGRIDGGPTLPNVVLLHAPQIMATLDTFAGELLLESEESSIC